MGEVYRANDTRLSRTVAIKILPAHLSEDAAARQRFEREARAVSSLTHPNICALYDVGHEDGRDFLVMELLEGETLADRLERGPLPTDELLKNAIQIADALDKAHRQGVIHRDLKPGNVMLTKDGAKLLDFGLAKAALPMGGGSSLTASPTMTTPLTRCRHIVGTFQYMSPEQLEGKEADARSDVFAFGVLLHEMATGRKAFDGQTQASLIASILKEHPSPISTLQPMAPPALDRLVETCVAKDPDERRQSMHDVLLELKWIAEAGSQAGVPVPVAARRRSRARLAWTTAAVLGVSTMVLAFVTWQLASRPRQIVRAFIPPPKARCTRCRAPAPDRWRSRRTVPGWHSFPRMRRATASSGYATWIRCRVSRSPAPRARFTRSGLPTAKPWRSSPRASSRRSPRRAAPPCRCATRRTERRHLERGRRDPVRARPRVPHPPRPAAGGEATAITAFDEEREDNSHRFR